MSGQHQADLGLVQEVGEVIGIDAMAGEETDGLQEGAAAWSAFGQLAIVVGRRGLPARLVSCA